MILVGVGGYVLANGMMQIRESSFVPLQKGMQYLYGNIEEVAARYYFAAGFYDAEQSDVWKNQIWKKIVNSVPLLTYTEQDVIQETIIEDEETYDFIIEESKNMIRKQKNSIQIKVKKLMKNM